MTTPLDDLIGQLEDYIGSTRAQLDPATDQERYWRGVLFGLELALLEAQKRQTLPGVGVGLPEDLADQLNQAIYDELEKVIALCQARLNRDLLTYNARVARYELLKTVRLLADLAGPSDYELRADPDRNHSSNTG